jgi:hypothetical protein
MLCCVQLVISAEKVGILNSIRRCMILGSKYSHYIRVQNGVYGDILRVFCYITKKGDTYVYDKLDPFAAIAVDYIVKVNRGKIVEKNKEIRILCFEGKSDVISILSELEKQSKKKVS